MAVVNSFILFREHQANFPDDLALHRTRDYSLAHFREEIDLCGFRDLCGFPEYDQPPQSDAMPVKQVPDLGKYRTVHVPMLSPDRKSCVVCLQKTKKCFKVQTYCSAPSCKNKFMHMTRKKNCFHIFHNTDEYDHTTKHEEEDDDNDDDDDDE